MSDYDRLLQENRQGKPVIIYVNKVQRVIGAVHDRKFIKVVSKSKHFLHEPPAIGIDKEAFDDTIAKECDFVIVLDSDNRDFYTSSVRNFLSHALFLNRGHGGQLALPMKNWGKNTFVKEQKQLF